MVATGEKGAMEVITADATGARTGRDDARHLATDTNDT